MSGIVGIINQSGAPVEREVLRRMTEFMAFRGPDAQTIWIQNQVGFGHALLRTTRESLHEQQPCTLDGNLWITADARVDDRATLIQKLKSKGVGASEAAADVDLILLAYSVWGEECVQHLLGDFAFAIWDGQRRRLFCARDHFGVKPFYYAQVGNCLIFSNTLNCVRKHPAVSSELNDLAIGDYLLFGANQEIATTSFIDIQRLPPAHYLIWSAGQTRIHRYWTLPVDGHIRYKRQSEYVDHFRELLDAAVADRLRTDKVAVSMSGGLDSTSIAATANKLLSAQSQPSNLQAFTIVYDRLIPDQERYYSGLAAKSIGIPIHYHIADDYALYEGWDKPERQPPEPDEYPLFAMFFDYLKQIGTHSRVTLCGDGGDLVFLASQPYFADLLKNFRLAPIISYMIRHLRSYGSLPKLGFRTTLKRWLGLHSRWQYDYPTWLKEPFAADFDLPSRLAQINEEPASIHPTRPEAYNSLIHAKWPYFFEQRDPGVSLIPVESRFPFFDLRLIEYFLAIPPIPWTVHKELLRVVMQGILPEPVRLRRKTPLAGDPVFARLRGRKVNLATQFEQTPALAKYIDTDAFSKINGEEDRDQLWSGIRLFSLNCWLLNYKLLKTM